MAKYEDNTSATLKSYNQNGNDNNAMTVTISLVFEKKASLESSKIKTFELKPIKGTGLLEGLVQPSMKRVHQELKML
jgi:hypothetical protein